MTDSFLLQCAACGAEQRVPTDGTSGSRNCLACGAPQISSHSLPIEVSDAIWDDELPGTSPAIVVVWGDACGACADYEASVQLMASDLYGEARVYRLNIDRNPATVARFQLTGVPTVLLFREGALLATLPGPQGERGLREKLGLD